MIDKYISLLLDKCLDINGNDSLFISYNKVNEDFVEKLVKYANSKNVFDIYLDESNTYETHDYLVNNDINSIENKYSNPNWDIYASKKAKFLMLVSELPGVMDDVDSDKIEAYSKCKQACKPLYRKYQSNGTIYWCIAALPNQLWADSIIDSTNSLDEFWNYLSEICFLDKENPNEEWDNYLNKQQEIIEKLNKLNIKKLHYSNSLGTDLTITMPSNHLWCSASSSSNIVNMPSYEIFSSPDYRYTEGIVYNSKPLLYNGVLIDDFYLKFKDGKVIDFDAKKGKNVLKSIISADSNSSYLGEVSLVNNSSPINMTNIIFKSTLFDENASCHLALGSGFLEAIDGGLSKSHEELLEYGINSSNTHVDFMIGTSDLKIDAECDSGNITIMENGEIII